MAGRNLLLIGVYALFALSFLHCPYLTFDCRESVSILDGNGNRVLTIVTPILRVAVLRASYPVTIAGGCAFIDFDFDAMFRG